MITRPMLRWLGGKWRLAPWIISHFPLHRIWLEPYGGAASITLRKDRAYNEIVNDLDDDLVNLYRVLRSPDADQLIRHLALTPYALTEYRAAFEPTDCPVERARRLVVRSHMSHGSNGARVDRPLGFRRDGPSGSTNVAGEWADFPDALRLIVERFRGVNITQRPALDLIADYETPDALIYLDPPYVPETRSSKARSGEGYHAYTHEMSLDDHAAMLAQIATHPAMIILSGYPNPMYDAALPGWRRVEIEARAHRNSPRREALWLNPATLAARDAGPLFGVR